MCVLLYFLKNGLAYPNLKGCTLNMYKVYDIGVFWLAICLNRSKWFMVQGILQNSYFALDGYQENLPTERKIPKY